MYRDDVVNMDVLNAYDMIIVDEISQLQDTDFERILQMWELESVFWEPWTQKPRNGLLRSFGGFLEGFCLSKGVPDIERPQSDKISTFPPPPPRAGEEERSKRASSSLENKILGRSLRDVGFTK